MVNTYNHFIEIKIIYNFNNKFRSAVVQLCHFSPRTIKYYLPLRV